MSKNVDVVVDFDGIVENLKPIPGTNNYTGCDAYVTYCGSVVSGTTFTLTKNKKYTFTLVAKKGNTCVATKFPLFEDSDLKISTTSNELVIACKATKKDTQGKNVTFGAVFDAAGTVSTASWDPKIIVEEPPAE